MEHQDETRRRDISRRTMLKLGLAGVIGSEVALVQSLAWTPQRTALAASTLPDIQFDIGNFIAPARTFNDGAGNVLARFGPVFTFFVPATLSRNPTKSDQTVLANALSTIEAHYAFSPAGVFTFISYGIPYFNRLPSALVNSHIPPLTDHVTPALQEAVPGPTDVSSQNPSITKATFNVPVVIEKNDLLFTLRSDSTARLNDVLSWLKGSNVLNGQTVTSPAFNGLIRFQTSRMMFQQNGLPRSVAQQAGLLASDGTTQLSTLISPDTPMWMGFLDQQVDGSGPAQICTFVGNSSHKETEANPGDYFDNAAIQHLSHVIEDLVQFYKLPSGDDPEGEPFTERVQYMHRSNPIPSAGNTDQFANGGGPAFIDNVNQGVDDAFHNATGNNTFQGARRLGHVSCLQRSSRAADGTPVHIRMDGTGFDAMDVPGGVNTPKLQFTVFVPSAQFFKNMRANQASLDFQQAFAVDQQDNGLERFTTATRRQNFLCPPRRHRAFPLLELT